jgi:hypothetical protein
MCSKTLMQVQIISAFLSVEHPFLSVLRTASVISEQQIAVGRQFTPKHHVTISENECTSSGKNGGGCMLDKAHMAFRVKCCDIYV